MFRAIAQVIAALSLFFGSLHYVQAQVCQIMSERAMSELEKVQMQRDRATRTDNISE